MKPYVDHAREALAAIAIRLDQAPHGQRTAIAKEEAARRGVSLPTLYRQLEALGRDSGRKTRADKGTSKVSPDAARMIAAVIRQGRRLNGKETTGTVQANFVASCAGLGVHASESTINRQLRAQRLSIRAQRIPSPHVEQRTLHPNHIHMVDPSLCLVYYIGKKQHIMTEDRFYKNKPTNIENVKLKVWRYVLVDHASGSITLRYFESKGENQRTLFDFLMWAWQKQDGRTQHGVPVGLMMDPGSANIAQSIGNLCRALDCEPMINKPGQPRAKGAVEVAQNIVERAFESLLKFQPVQSCEELNDYAVAWQEAFNANLIPGVSSRVARPGFAAPQIRIDLWLKIRPEQLRLCPPTHICAQLMHSNAQERTIAPNMRITFRHPQAGRTMVYDVDGIKGLNRKDKVYVQALVYGNFPILVTHTAYNGEDVTTRLEPITEFNEFGVAISSPIIGQEYHAMHKTDADYISEDLDRIAYGTDADGVVRTDEEIAKAIAKRERPFAAMDLRPLDLLKGVTQRTNLPKRGTPLVPKAPEIQAPRENPLEAAGIALNVPSEATFAVRRLNTFEAASELQRLLCDAWTAETYQQLVEWFPDGLPEDQLQEVVDRMQAAAQRGRMQIINGGAA